MAFATAPTAGITTGGGFLDLEEAAEAENTTMMTNQTEEDDMMTTTTTTTLPQPYSNPDNVQSAMSMPH